LIDEKTVFILGAGASCPYGYPSGSGLRKLICFRLGFMEHYTENLRGRRINQSHISEKDIREFTDAFRKSHIKSIDLFMANNPKLAPTGKRIISYEVFRAEKESYFGEEREEEAKNRQERLENLRQYGDARMLRMCGWGTAGIQGGDWYFYLYNRLIEGLVGKDTLPDFSDGKLAFITFNYDRSLEYFLYVALRNSFTEVAEDKIVQSLKQLKILHVYGQIAPLKWQNPNDYVDYKPRTDESLLQRAADNIRTIYEEKDNPELIEAQNLIKQAGKIFFLGFGYAPENMSVLDLPALIPQNCLVYGTAFGTNDKEVKRTRNRIINGIRTDSPNNKVPDHIQVEPTDCLELLRNYFE